MMKIIFVMLSSFGTAAPQMSDVSPRTEPGPELNIEKCSTWSGDTWDRYIREVLFSEDTLGIDKAKVQYAHIYSTLHSASTYCPENYRRPRIRACLSRIEQYYMQFSWNKDRTIPLYGGTQSTVYTDQQLYDSQPAGRMSLPREFASAPYGLPLNWRNIANKKEWKWVYYTSAFSGEDRIMFLIPHEEYVQYVLYFFYRTKDPGPPENLLGIQMITVEKYIGGQKLEKPLIHFRSFKFKGDQMELHHWQERCISCHAGGPQSIIPDLSINPGTIPTEVSPNTTLAEINKIMRLREVPDLKRYYNMQALPDFLVDDDITIEADKCTNCHDGKDRVSLTHMLTTNGDISGIIRDRLHDPPPYGMPYDALIEYTTEERYLMLKQIRHNFKRQLRRWMTEIKCAD